MAQDPSLLDTRGVSTVARRRIHVMEVPHAQRPAFLPKHFGKAYVRGEAAVFGWMSRLSPAYRGGFWGYFELSNGGFFMAPDASACSVQDGRAGLAIRWEDNGFSGFLSPQAAGIVATAFSVNHLLFAGEHHLEDAYWRLMDFVNEHEEALQIRRALD
jgi:hypothetical protein